MNRIKYLIAIITIALAISCNDEIPLTLQDEFLGIDNSDTQKLYLRTGSGQPSASGIQAQLVAAHRSSPTNFTFAIDPASTAIEGLHYTVSGNSGTIPANSSYGEIPIQILPDNINPGEVLSLIVSITGGDLRVEDGFSTATFSVQVLCPNTIPLDRTWTITIIEGAFGASATRSDITITDAGDGTLLVSDITAGVLPALGCCDADESAYILNVCDVITIDRNGPDADLNYSTNADAGYGPGSWDPDNQILTLPWWENGNEFGAVVTLTPN